MFFHYLLAVPCALILMAFSSCATAAKRTKASDDSHQSTRLQAALKITAEDAETLLNDICVHLQKKGESTIRGMIVQIPDEKPPVVLIGRIFADTGGYGYRVELKKAGGKWRVKTVILDVAS